MSAAEPKQLNPSGYELKTPPIGADARIQIGRLLWLLQSGESVGLPHSRPMPSVGGNCHELRVRDSDANWRIIYYTGAESIVILTVFSKKTPKTPLDEIERAKKRLAEVKVAK